ncbi:unnamed protein product [Camellia sinensis]
MAKRKGSETQETPSKKQKLSQSSYGLGSKTSSKTLETPRKKEQLSQSSYHLRSKTSTKTPQTPSQNTQVQADEATSIQMSTPTSKTQAQGGKNLSKHLLELQKTPFWYLIQALTT